MPTISDLFKNQKKELYGKSDTIRIDSRGLINPPRGVALLLSTPNSLGDLIGNQIAGGIRGSANRPSDTIFKDNSFLAKPISLFKTPSDLRDAVKAGTEYFVKQSPTGASILGKIKQGASNPLGTIAEVGIDLLKGLKDKNPTKGAPYGQKYQTTINGKTLTETKTFSGFYQKYKQSTNPRTNQVEYIGDETEIRTGYSWDDANNSVNGLDSYTKEDKTIRERKNSDANQVWVTFQKYGNNEIIPFAGTITGLSEDVTPEWTNFKYLGSPFKTYRYQGVERNLNFELKLYYTSHLNKATMIKKINYLKSLVFPYEQISQIKYGEESDASTQYAFSPNLVTLSIGDMYKNLFGFIETLNFTVDDNTSWPNEDFNMELDKANNKLYPSVVSVSIAFRIIEEHETETKPGVTRYKYNFDGLNQHILETQKKTQQNASPKEKKLQPSISNETVKNLLSKRRMV